MPRSRIYTWLEFFASQRRYVVATTDVVRQWGIIGIILVCVAVGTWMALQHHQAISFASRAQLRELESTSAPSLQDRAGVPWALEKSINLAGAFDQEGIRNGVGRLRRTRPTTLSGLLHVLRVFGKESLVANPATGEEVKALEIALDAEKTQVFFQSQPSLFETRTGVRCPVLERGQSYDKQHERQAHTDQLLAALAELEIPLSHPLRTRTSMRTIRDLLADSMANFALDQKEIEWSALAFTLYLPPQRSWTDKFGKACDFDKLAEELLARGLEGSCGGSHILFALTAMLQIDQRTAILTADMRQKVSHYLQRMVVHALRSQSPAGAWGKEWYRNGENSDLGLVRPSGADQSEVLITGHQLEWMMFLPPGLSPPRDCFLQAASWLLQQLLTAPLATIENGHCPFSHAGHVLMLLSANSEQ
jgi:hypothetical protein